MGRFGLWLGACLLVAGCATAPPPRAILDYAGQEGGVQLFVQPADADVYVDGEYMGKARDFQGDHALWLPRGLHAMEVRRDGYHTFFRQLETTLGLIEVLVYTLPPNMEAR
jgi:hypothetical protein